MSSPCVTLSASLNYAAGVRFQGGRANRLRKGRYRYFFLHPDNLSFRSHFDVKFKTVDFELGLIKFS